MSTSKIKKIAIIGLGLIGGSLALALKDSESAEEIVGIDINPEHVTIGRQMQAIHWGTSALDEGVKGAEIVILATPVCTIIEIAKQIAPFLPAGCIVTDVGSCKAKVTKELETIFVQDKYYVGGHPMAGSEQGGILAAHRYLFENAVYVLGVTPQTNATALARLEDLLSSATGARILQLSPEQHDLIVAAVSHLPHLMAVNLVNTVGEVAKTDELTLMLAAGGFRDTTRIAMGDINMWRDIFTTNREMILRMISVFKEQLQYLENAVSAGEHQAIASLLGKARELRKSIPAKGKGLLPSIYELVVAVPDKPGMIAEIAGLLAKANINIIDIEILRVREAAGGSIQIGFHTEEDVRAAVQVLQQHQYTTKQR